MPKSQNTQAITEPETVNSGIDSSNAMAHGGGTASPNELALALEMSQRTIELLTAQLEKERANNSGSNSINQLADILASAVSKRTVEAAPNVDNINRTTDFKNTKVNVDGRSLMEAQQTLQSFRSEHKKPISIPKALANSVGTTLTITVNGVRVSIPCDGKTYMINETHWEHARERMAKIDALVSDTEPQVIEVS